MLGDQTCVIHIMSASRTSIDMIRSTQTNSAETADTALPIQKNLPCAQIQTIFITEDADMEDGCNKHSNV